MSCGITIKGVSNICLDEYIHNGVVTSFGFLGLVMATPKNGQQNKQTNVSKVLHYFLGMNKV